MKKIFLAGHNGMVGSAIYKLLKYRKNIKIITRSHSELDLCDQIAVKNFNTNTALKFGYNFNMKFNIGAGK